MTITRLVVVTATPALATTTPTPMRSITIKTTIDHPTTILVQVERVTLPTLHRPVMVKNEVKRMMSDGL